MGVENGGNNVRSNKEEEVLPVIGTMVFSGSNSYKKFGKVLDGNYLIISGN